MNLCERKKSFIKLPTLILYQKLGNFWQIFGSFWQIRHFGATGWMGLELSFILTQIV